MIHPAHAMSFADLVDGLDAAKAAKCVSEQQDGNGLSLFCYTKGCVYERAWTPITMAARGLILDRRESRIVATPFPKFFNLGEMLQEPPALGFETFEKLDGSLVILFFHNGEWRTATKGSFGSSQAQWAADWIKRFDLSLLPSSVTYLCEAIYPENRIVIHYDAADLVLLAAYANDGVELSRADLEYTATRMGWRCALRHEFESIADLVAHVGTLKSDEEGFVLRFENGLRLKVKGEEYRRIHALISRCTPLAMWEAMAAGDNMDLIRRELPEEFWADFDQITGLIGGRVSDVATRASKEAAKVAHLSDKEVGLQLDSFPEDVRRLIFPLRKSGDLLANPKSRQAVFKQIRPTANQLPGYVPSYAMNRVVEELL